MGISIFNFAMGKKNSSSAPDFDYPETVAKNADSRLKVALELGNGADVVRYLVQSSLAKSMISTDNAQSLIERVDSVAQCESSPQYRAILYYFEAKMLHSFYLRSSYKISQRKTVADAVDINEWSEPQFFARITELADKATADTRALTAMSIDELGDLIVKNEYSSVIFPSLLDMLAWNVIGMIDRFSDEYADAEKLVSKLQSDIISVHANDYAPLINALIYGKTIPERLDIYREYASRTDMAYIAIDAVKSLPEMEQYATYSKFLSDYPASIFTDNVKRLKTNLEARGVTVSFNERFSSSSPISIECRVKNASDFTVYVIQLPDNVTGAYGFRGKWSDLPIRRYKSVHCDGSVPFTDTVQVKLPALPHGRYIVYCDPDTKSAPTVYDKLKNVSRHQLDAFLVSDIMLFSASTKENESRVFAVDANSGAPLSGVTITVTENGQSFTTGADGSVLLVKDRLKDVKYSSCDVVASRGNDNLTTMRVSFDKNYQSTGNRAQIFTDLAVYHPGDTVRFAAVCHSLDAANSRSVLAGLKLNAVLYDSNYETVDSIACTTDEFGRIDGSFVIPRDRMNGTFQLSVSTLDGDDLSSAEIEVSDYKVPTFFVETSSPDFFEKGKDAVITGKAMTYTGIPLANARITATLSLQEWSWWWRFDADKSLLHTFQVTTGPDGSFSIVVPADALNAPDVSYRFSQYVVDIDVTSDAGETQSASASFRTSQFCTIELKNTPDLCFNADNELCLPVEVRCTDPGEKPVCSYTLSDASGNVVAQGSFSPSKPVVENAAAIKSGKYACRVEGPHDASLSFDITIFRPSDKLPPVESPLWIPACESRVDDNNRVSLLLGNSNADSHIYCIAASRKKVIREGWLKMKPGLHSLYFDIPKDENEFVDLTFITVANGESHRLNFRFDSKYRPNDITIKPLVFRDNLVPGSAERWSFQLVDARGNLVKGAMICELMDNAINKIAKNDWDFPTPSVFTAVSWSNIMRSSLNINTFNKFLSTANLKQVEIELPQLFTYNVNIFAPTYRFKGSRPRIMYNLNSDFDEGSDNLNVQYGAMAVAPDAVMEEAEDAVVESATAVTGSAAGAKSNLDNVKVRTADIQTALWRPQLRTDADGNIFIDFTAPDFCTTWLMQAVAYTADVHTARIVKEVMTTKPLMVRANMPRFVRQGDKVQIASSVINASDSAQQCTALVEIFNIADNVVLASRQVDLSLAARESKPVTIDWTVPDTLACVGYRVKAATSQFGDGEQHALVILPSVSPVVETLPFFIDANNKNFELNLPKFNKGSRVTLEYSDNPVWYCVTALPSLASDNELCSTSIAHSLYALLVARGIAVSSPEIREAVNYWNTHEADSTLVSNLAKNGELKIGTLLASPWLREADRQTLRMHSISELFDDVKSQQQTDKLIEKLEGMQMSDGGFTWVNYDRCTSSFYATHTILQLLGEVRRLGYIAPDSRLDNMLSRAVAYYDAEQLEIFRERKNPNDFSHLSDYVYTRSLYSDIPILADMKTVHRKALAAMRTEWKGLQLPAKAYFAMALHRNGDKVTPKNILRSLREFSITKPATGMYWDNLQIGWDCFYSKTALTTAMLSAFAEIDPLSPDVDLIRKWVLLDKQANDWGGSSLASGAINAILSSGSKWLGKQQPARISVAGTEVTTGDADRFIGYFKRTLSVEAASESLLKVSRQGDSPAWGTLYCQYSAPIISIKPAQVDELSIAKEIYIVDGDRLVKADNARVGDRLQIRFVIKNSRDLQYVTLHDERAACCEPVEQLSEYRWLDGTGYYMEVKNDATRLFFNYLPKGTHVITYDVHVTAPGTYNVGVASIQSQYAPQIAAHSAGATITTLHP